jgi:hypothetical protein
LSKSITTFYADSSFESLTEKVATIICFGVRITRKKTEKCFGMIPSKIDGSDVRLQEEGLFGIQLVII